MRQVTKLHIFLIVFLTAMIGFAQDQCMVVGWATQNGGVTGGGSATPTVVSTYAALKTALTTSSVKVVHISGTITFPTNGRITIQDTDGKTIIGLAGSRLISVDMTASGSGILYIKRSTNFIMRNITFEGPAAYDTDGNDNLTVDNCQNFWVDHCDFQDGMDGNFDIKNMSDYISITWCKFSYNKPPKAGGSGGSNDHRYTNLIGSSDGATGDAGKLRITFQYCWWAQGCVERMPRVRFGKIHLANNLFNSSVSNSCIRAGYKADLFIESNVFIGVKNPIDLFNNDFTAVTEKNNIFTNTSGGKSGSGTSFTPPYSLTIMATSTVQSLVTNTACGSGATLDSPTQCGCGTNPNPSPTATITAPTTACINTAITITATANANGGTLSKVDFYNGTTLIGSDNSSPYSITYTPTTTTALSLKAIATNTSGTTGSSTSASVTISALPTASISSTTTNLCTTGSIVLSTTSGASYKWFNGTSQIGTAATYTATTPGDYSVEVTNASGCKATSAVRTLNGLPQATPTITSSTTNLCTTGLIVLSTTSGASYKWFNGTSQVGTAATCTATTPGNYTVEVTNASGCKATSAVRTLSGIPQSTPTITSNATSFCTGSSLVLTASMGSSYKWFEGTTQVGTANTYTASTAGDYTVEVTNASGCKNTSAIKTIDVNPLPVITPYAKVDAGAWLTTTTVSTCEGSTLNLGPQPNLAAGWSWTGPNNFTSTLRDPILTNLVIANAGNYIATYTDPNGCKATSNFTVQISNPIATIIAPASSFCAGSSLVLTASTGTSYKWFEGTTQVGTSATYTTTTAGAYTVEVTNASGCISTSAVTQITMNAVPAAVITAPVTSFCTGSSVVLTASAGTSYKWYNGANQVGTASSYTATTAGAYTVEVSNANGCKSTSSAKQITVTATTTWYADTDNDGVGEISNTLNACTKPSGYVATAGDACPTDANKTAAGNCGCGNTEASCLDCNGTPNGTAVIDNCNICTGGTTGNTACVTTATVNGTSVTINVFPQPFDETTSISLENYGMIQNITIISSSGTIVETKKQINSESVLVGETLASGLYTAIIQSESGIHITKIVKK
jgi:pectate lyase